MAGEEALALDVAEEVAVGDGKTGSEVAINKLNDE
jgi:hypothetical protein